MINIITLNFFKHTEIYVTYNLYYITNKSLYLKLHLKDSKIESHKTIILYYFMPWIIILYVKTAILFAGIRYYLLTSFQFFTFRVCWKNRSRFWRKTNSKVDNRSQVDCQKLTSEINALEFLKKVGQKGKGEVCFACTYLLIKIIKTMLRIYFYFSWSITYFIIFILITKPPV